MSRFRFRCSRRCRCCRLSRYGFRCRSGRWHSRSYRRSTVWFHDCCWLEGHFAPQQHNDQTAVSKIVGGHDNVGTTRLTCAENKWPLTVEPGDISIGNMPESVLNFAKLAKAVIYGRADSHRIAYGESVDFRRDGDMRSSLARPVE